MKNSFEKRALQAAVFFACLVPLCAGAAGMVAGSSAFQNGPAGIPLDSHVRYLSGLLFAIGIAFLATIPHIEQQTVKFRLLTLIVFMGGLARLAGIFLKGPPGNAMLFGLGMEVVATPVLCLRQNRISHRP